MGITLYGTPPSPPSHSVRLMLEYKGLDHKLVWLLPGLWPALLRTRGFRGGTVPAMKIEGDGCRAPGRSRVRWRRRGRTRVTIAREVGIPLPRFAAWINAPSARHLANKVDADDRIQEAIAEVPEALRHVDELIAKSVIAREEPNAADFQAATSVRGLSMSRICGPPPLGGPPRSWH